MPKIHKVGKPTKATKIKTDKTWRENLADTAFESVDLPMGITNYINHGKKYGYYDFLKKEFLEDMGGGKFNMKLKKYYWTLETMEEGYVFFLWDRKTGKCVASLNGENSSEIWEKIEILLTKIKSL